MQLPGDNMKYVFAAGGTSHDSYADCPFRVTKDGKLYASSGKISEFNITDNGLEWGNYGTKIWANTIQTSKLTATDSSTRLDIGTDGKKTYLYGEGGIYINDNLLDLSQYATTSQLSNYVTSSTFSNHNHSISNLNYSLTSHGNVEFGSYNLATTKWVSDKFESKGSDIRLKEDIEDMRDVLNLYMDLKPKTYRFKKNLTGYDKRLHYGFIAQDIEESIHKLGLQNSNLVYKERCEGEINEADVIGDEYVYRVDKNELHAMHVQMIQKHQREIEELKQQIKELKELINK